MIKKLLVFLAIVVSPFALSESGAINGTVDLHGVQVDMGNDFLYSQSRPQESSATSIDDLVLALNVNPMRPMPHDEVCESEDKTKLCYCPDAICWSFRDDCFCN